MATAIAAPPVIAPGVVCPKCKGPMLVAEKRSEKSPDYECANMLCVKTGSNGKSYRTAVWAEKSGAEAVPAAGVQPPHQASAAAQGAAPSADERPTMREAYKGLTEWVLKEIAPIYEREKVGMSPESAAACVQTLFIQACYAGKVQ